MASTPTGPHRLYRPPGQEVILPHNCRRGIGADIETGRHRNWSVPTRATLEKWEQMIQETATHMADYLPGNGGLLYAVAMIAAGWGGGPECHASRFSRRWNLDGELGRTEKGTVGTPQANLDVGSVRGYRPASVVERVWGRNQSSRT